MKSALTKIKRLGALGTHAVMGLLATALSLQAGEVVSARSGPPGAPAKVTFNVTDEPLTYFEAWDALEGFQARSFTVTEGHIGYQDLRHGQIAHEIGGPIPTGPKRYFRQQNVTSSWSQNPGSDPVSINSRETFDGALNIVMHRDDSFQDIIDSGSAHFNSSTSYRTSFATTDAFGGVTGLTYSDFYTRTESWVATGNFHFSRGNPLWDAQFTFTDNAPGSFYGNYSEPGTGAANPFSHATWREAIYWGADWHFYAGSRTPDNVFGVLPAVWTDSLAQWSRTVPNATGGTYTYQYKLELSNEDTIANVQARIDHDRALVAFETIPWGSHRLASRNGHNVNDYREDDTGVYLYNAKSSFLADGYFYEERTQLRFVVPLKLRFPGVAYRGRIVEIFYPDADSSVTDIVKIHEVDLRDGQWESPIITPVMRDADGLTLLQFFSAASELIQPRKVTALPPSAGSVPATVPAEYKITAPMFVSQSQGTDSAGDNVAMRRVLTNSLTLQQINLADSWGSLTDFDTVTAKWSVLPDATAQIRLWHWKDDGSALGVWSLINPGDDLHAYFGSRTDYVFVEALTGGNATVRIAITVGGQEVNDDLLIHSSPASASLAVDANRDGVIDLPPESLAAPYLDQTTVAQPFRFWINDDDDSGDMGGDDIPGKTAGANYADGVVNGTRDLVDFFPVFLDLKQLLTVLPPSASVKYKLKQADSALNFVYTKLARDTTTTRDGALAYQKKILITGFGPNFTQAAGAATTQQITTAGVELSSSFLTGVKDSDWGVLLIEGRAATTAPLVLSVEKDGALIAEVKLELRISNVEDMFRHTDLTDVPREYNGTAVAPPVPASSTRTGDPGAPYPDTATNGKYFVFVHGFNVNGQRARGWNSEVFKRLYQMGSHARFVGVTWNGATGAQLPNGSYTDYHQAVFHAFQTGDALAARLASNGVCGDVTIAAHSLGNMVASQAIQYGGFSPSRYYMINAAVPLEAYHLGSVIPGDLERMTNIDWKNPPFSNGGGRLFAANWYLIFSDTGDHRSELTWKHRFDGVLLNAYNFYSPGDEVVEDPTTSSPSLLLTVINQGFSSAHGAWGLQELAKGTLSIASGFFSRTQAGWGEGAYWFPQPNTVNPSNAALMEHPFFEAFKETDLTNPTAAIASAKAGSKNVQYDLLARGIPALSFATAVHKLAPLDNLNPSLNRNFNMESDGRTQNQWPTTGHSGNDAGRWLHSDFKNVSLPYVYQMYQAMIEKGSL